MTHDFFFFALVFCCHNEKKNYTLKPAKLGHFVKAKYLKNYSKILKNQIQE